MIAAAYYALDRARREAPFRYKARTGPGGKRHRKRRAALARRTPPHDPYRLVRIHARSVRHITIDDLFTAWSKNLSARAL